MSDTRLKQAIRFYEEHGHVGPFGIRGGDGEGDGDGGEGGAGGGAGAKETEDVAGLKTALTSEREARKAAEKTAKDLDRRLKEIESSGKTESEKLAARLESLENDNKAKARAIQERDAKDAVRTAAKTAGAPDGDLIWRVLKGDIEYGDDGEATNVKNLIADLKQTTPHLFKTTPRGVDGGAGTGAKPAAAGINAFIRQAAGYE